MFLKSSTMAHTGETHLFLENFFDLQSPSWPRRNPRRKTQAWIKCAGDTPNSSNWNHSRILKCKNPFLHISNKVQFTSDWFNSETISTHAGFTSETISNLGVPTFFPFLNKYKLPYPFFEISLLIDSTLYLIGRWLWWGRRERRRIPQSPVLKQLGKTTETLATLCVYLWHSIKGFEVSKFPALIVSPAAVPKSAPPQPYLVVGWRNSGARSAPHLA